jgi:hypothetical protein
MSLFIEKSFADLWNRCMRVMVLERAPGGTDVGGRGPLHAWFFLPGLTLPPTVN